MTPKRHFEINWPLVSWKNFNSIIDNELLLKAYPFRLQTQTSDLYLFLNYLFLLTAFLSFFPLPHIIYVKYLILGIWLFTALTRLCIQKCFSLTKKCESFLGYKTFCFKKSFKKKMTEEYTPPTKKESKKKEIEMWPAV